MECPRCGAKTGVIETISLGVVIIRRRKCKRCGYNFKTQEVVYVSDAELERLLQRSQSKQKSGH